ncbi:MAG: (2Fe-2S)-binding protein [Leptolyngbyaceae cyanobacterium CAN_BIN12]|nr:(2Fe-2S)-binding protein [Leptolyngbyaceae cyanobacterium CAN_BIN12]
MPTIKTQHKTFECELGANLRQAMLNNGATVYNGAACAINCHGFGTCGTCAVQIEGMVSEMEWQEKARLSLPPHSLDSDRRLSCQVKVLGDISVTKYQGFWGQDQEKIQ